MVAFRRWRVAATASSSFAGGRLIKIGTLVGDPTTEAKSILLTYVFHVSASVATVGTLSWVASAAVTSWTVTVVAGTGAADGAGDGAPDIGMSISLISGAARGVLARPWGPGVPTVGSSPRGSAGSNATAEASRVRRRSMRASIEERSGSSLDSVRRMSSQRRIEERTVATASEAVGRRVGVVGRAAGGRAGVST